MSSSRDLAAASIDLLLGGSCVGCGRPGPSLCARCGAVLEALPHRARPSPCPPGLPPVYAVAAYDTVARTALVAHKEEARLALTKPLGRALALSVFGVLAQAAQPAGVPVTLVPVPSMRATVRQRGHDPLLRMTRECRRALRAAGVVTTVDTALKVDRPVADQAGLSAEQRAGNLRHAFTVRRQSRLDGRPIVIVDDIITTGSTAADAVRAAQDAGATVLGVAVVAATQRRRG